MKTNKTVKKLLSLMLCFAVLLSTMATAMAADVGDTVDIASEFGDWVITNKVDTAMAASQGDYPDEPGTNKLTYSKISANYYTNHYGTAYYVNDTTLDAAGVNVAVMKKDTADTYLDGAYVGSVYSGIKSNVKWTDATNLSDEWILDVKFKVPVAEDVTTTLFDMSNASWSGKDDDNYHQMYIRLNGGIIVKNGYIYTAADTAFANALNPTQLSADTWYRLVRHVKGGIDAKNKKRLYEKIYVIDSANAVVAQLTEWTQIGTYEAGKDNAMAAVAFTTEYPANFAGKEAAVAPLSIYKAPTAVPPSASLEGSSRTLEYIADGDSVDSNPVAERLAGRNYAYNRQNAFVTFRLPDDESGVLKLFRWNDSVSKKAGVDGPFADSFAVTVKGGKVYANIYNQASTLNGDTASEPAKSYTKLEEVSTGVYYTETQIPDVTIEANKWYTIEIQRTNIFDNAADNILNIYNGKVIDNGDGTVTGTLLKTWGKGNNFYLPYYDGTKVLRTVTDSKGVSTDYSYNLGRTLTFFAGYGFSKPIYVDGFRLDAWQTMTSKNICPYMNASYGVDNNWTLGYDSATSKVTKTINIGDDFTAFRLYNASSGNWVSDTPIPVGATVAYDSDFLSTEVTYSREVPTIKIEFPKDIQYNDSLITLKNQNDEAVNFDASYDAETKTATLSKFGKLNYGDTYTLTVAPATTNIMGFATAERTYTFDCIDSFKISDVKILDANDAEVTASPAENAVINGSVKLQNLSGEARPYLVILALYSGDNMKYVKTVSGEVLAGATPVIETPTITVDEAGCSAKVMVWESWTNLIPKAEAYTVSAQ